MGYVSISPPRAPIENNVPRQRAGRKTGRGRASRDLGCRAGRGHSWAPTNRGPAWAARAWPVVAAVVVVDLA
eukprot:8958357-Pyramimonas_sp.AAC.1